MKREKCNETRGVPLAGGTTGGYRLSFVFPSDEDPSPLRESFIEAIEERFAGVDIATVRVDGIRLDAKTFHPGFD